MKIDMDHIIVQKYIGPMCFLAATITSLFFFIDSLSYLSNNIHNKVVLINQGSYYMPGVFLGLLSLSSVLIWDQWFKRTINDLWRKVISYMLIASIILTFSLPHIIYYFANHYLVNNGYQICEAASRNWLYIHKIVYVHPPQACYKTLVFP